MATSSPRLIVPVGERIAPDGTASVAGISYSDRFAAGNPGAMYLHVWDGAGLLRATNSAGVPVPGSGTASIALSASYAEVNAVLASLRYAAAATGGPDSISFDLWNQGGVETTGSIPIAVGAVSTGGGAADTWTGAVGNDWNSAGNWSSAAVPAAGEQVVIPGGTPQVPTLHGATLSGEHVTLASGGGQGGSVAFTDVTLGAGTSLIDTASDTLAQPAVPLAGTFTVGQGATLAAASGSLLTLGSASAGAPARVVNQGTIAGMGGHLNIDTGGTVVNDGLVTANGAGGVGFDFAAFTNAMPAETILNAGTMQATGGASLFINGTVQGGALACGGGGTIVLEQPNALADGATITGFGANDSIELYLINAGSLAYANGVLSVTNGGTVVESLPMQGTYTTANFRMTYQPGAQFSNLISYVPDAPTNDPQIAAPGSQQVAAGGTLAVTGVSVADSDAATHAGAMALNVTDSSGTLRMTDGNGAPIPGSGTGAIHDSGTFSQINAALASLTYIAPADGGADSIRVNVWDQLGQQATQAIGVTVGGSPAGGGPVVSGPVVSGTVGDDTIVCNLNDATINAGPGDNSVFAGGSGDSITTGDGNNTIQAFAGGNTITAGGGSDTIRIAGGGSVVDAGAGSNTIADSGADNTLVLPAAGAGSDDIFGYVLAANDLFDLRHALGEAGWNGDQARLSSYLGTSTTNGGADATVQVVPGGHGGGATVATLRGSGAVSLADFLSHALVSGP